ncbi:hypothetical protein [Halosegnis marinus]|uniref:Small CPxCG-related zinc finger protein n=1 Tax=Halosegnis marinus TaxID=3034023 RepID=A0ABD5ZN13_9EURY|nr:hypothetical protein [Halosegnis sp. DT85]
MSAERVDVRCRSCGRRTPLELDGGERFTVACESCGAERNGRYRDDGTVVWS